MLVPKALQKKTIRYHEANSLILQQILAKLWHWVLEKYEPAFNIELLDDLAKNGHNYNHTWWDKHEQFQQSVRNVGFTTLGVMCIIGVVLFRHITRRDIRRDIFL